MNNVRYSVTGPEVTGPVQLRGGSNPGANCYDSGTSRGTAPSSPTRLKCCTTSPPKAARW